MTRLLSLEPLFSSEPVSADDDDEYNEDLSIGYLWIGSGSPVSESEEILTLGVVSTGCSRRTTSAGGPPVAPLHSVTNTFFWKGSLISYLTYLGKDDIIFHVILTNA